MTTAYETLKQKMHTRRGRAPLPPEEKARRAKHQKAENRRRAEARRRAYLVLQHRYENEFKVLFEDEYTALENDKRFMVTN
jgi:hypothetical protein